MILADFVVVAAKLAGIAMNLTPVRPKLVRFARRHSRVTGNVWMFDRLCAYEGRTSNEQGRGNSGHSEMAHCIPQRQYPARAAVACAARTTVAIWKMLRANPSALGRGNFFRASPVGWLSRAKQRGTRVLGAQFEPQRTQRGCAASKRVGPMRTKKDLTRMHHDHHDFADWLRGHGRSRPPRQAPGCFPGAAGSHAVPRVFNPDRGRGNSAQAWSDAVGTHPRHRGDRG